MAETTQHNLYTPYTTSRIRKRGQTQFFLSVFYFPQLTAEEKLNLTPFPNSLPGGYSEWEPPDPIPNSEVKLLSADDSVGFPHVKVGHRQALIAKPR